MSTPRNQPPSPLSPASYRMEDDRRRDEARILALQDQIDELRQFVRELLGRQSREEEITRQYEAGIVQNRMAIEQFKQDVAQALQARALDEARTREQIVDLETRIDDVARPIRNLQAHVNEVLETTRSKGDEYAMVRQRNEEVDARIEHIAALIDRGTVVSHQLRDGIEVVRTEMDEIRREIMRAEDTIKIVDQDGRRRVADVSQIGDALGSRIDELRSDLGHLFELADDTRRSVAHVDPDLEDLRNQQAVLRGEIAKVNTQAIERHETMIDRLEDSRQELDGRIADTKSSSEQRFDRLTDRIDELIEGHRDLGFRISSFTTQLDELRIADGSVRRDLWLREEQRVRLRLEQAQQELDLIASQRRERESGESAGAAAKPRRQTDH